MSNRWPGGIIRKTPVTPAGPLQNGAASGVWTLADAAYWTKQGLWPLAGNLPPAIEDVFSTYLYAGDGASSQTVTTNVNLASGGGLVWQKGRSAVSAHYLFDTTRNDSDYLRTNQTNDVASFSGRTLAIGTSGFTVGSDTAVNGSGSTFATWSFKKSPKFFDLVTWTGNGANRTIAHNLGVAPGCIIVKRLNGFSDWQVYHRSNANTQYQVLNSTAAVATGTTRWNSTTPTATEFTVGTDTTVNASGGTYVAYLYAHDTASTGLIQCGSFTADGSGNVTNQNLGWEPQWILLKTSSSTEGWILADNMRGWSYSSTQGLFANTSGAEFGNTPIVIPTANGFVGQNGQLSPSQTYIYIAIRRGPMRTPTLGTSVFLPIARNGTNATATITTGFTVDLHISKTRTVANSPGAFDRLRGAGNFLNPASTAAEDAVNFTDSLTSFANNTGDGVGADSGGGVINFGTRPYANWAFSRAPGFFDVVAYTGTGSATTFNHNLGVVPELMIVKTRSLTAGWQTYSAALANTEYLVLNTTAAKATGTTRWNSTTPTSTVFTLGTAVEVNNSSSTYVNYLFASCPGVSKVGSYTGTGALQTVNCAFTTGARFVLIKRTDSTGDWYVWDSARGISSGNDPYLLLNSIAVEETGTNYVDTDTTGFKVTAAAPAALNAVGGTYIFLAIA